MIIIASACTGYYLIISDMETMKKQATDEHEMAILEINRYEVEENAVFTDYSKEALLGNIEHFKHMTVYQRSALAKNIDSVKEVLGKDSKEYLHFLMLLVKIP